MDRPDAATPGTGGNVGSGGQTASGGGGGGKGGYGGYPGVGGAGTAPDTAGAIDSAAAVDVLAPNDTAAVNQPDGLPRPAPDTTFTPSKLDSLVLWLDAAKMVTTNGGKVSRWGDLSSKHNDAVQNDAKAQPLLSDKSTGGLPALKFEASRRTHLTIADSPSLNWAKDDFAVLLVASYNNKAGIHLDGYAFMFHKLASAKTGGQPEPAEVIIAGNWPNGDTVPMVTKLTLSLNAHMVKAHSKLEGYNDGVTRVIAGFRSSQKIEIRINGERAGGPSAGDWDVNSVGNPVALGSTANGNFAVNGEISEVVALKAPVTLADVQKVEDYLKAKYGIKSP